MMPLVTCLPYDESGDDAVSDTLAGINTLNSMAGHKIFAT